MNPTFNTQDFSVAWTVLVIVLALLVLSTIIVSIHSRKRHQVELAITIGAASTFLVAIFGFGAVLTAQSGSYSNTVRESISQWSEDKYNLVLPESSVEELVVIDNTINGREESVLNYKREKQVLKTYGSTNINLKDGAETIVLVLSQGEFILTDSKGQEIEKQ